MFTTSATKRYEFIIHGLVHLYRSILRQNHGHNVISQKLKVEIKKLAVMI